MFKVNYIKVNNNKNINLNIAFLTDIHYSNVFDKVLENNIIEKITLEKPNYIFITGDIIDQASILNTNIIYNLKRFLVNLSKNAKVILVLGGHDLQNTSDKYDSFSENMDKWKKLLENEKDIYLLDNDCYKEKYINIIGITLPFDYYNKKPYENKQIVINKLKNYKIDKNKYNILLIHSPRRVFSKNIPKFDLILSGHMHDGMFPKIIKKLPTSIGIISPHKGLFPRNARGKITKNGTTLIVSGGVTKLSPALPKLIKKFKFLYNNEIEIIRIRDNNG